jgi:hypothetical protein
MLSTSGYVFAAPIFSNIPRTSGCPTPAVSFAITSSNFFDEVMLKRCTIICLLPIFSPKNFARSILPFIAGGRAAKKTEDPSKHRRKRGSK